MIIGLSGKARSGKDTVGRFLVQDSCFETIALAEPMKEFCREVFRFTEAQLHGDDKEVVDKRYCHQLGTNLEEWACAQQRFEAAATPWLNRIGLLRASDIDALCEWFEALRDGHDCARQTPRNALQTLGTEFGRVCFEDVWVRYALNVARERQSFTNCSGVAITDVRFENERDAIRAAGGKVWRIVRPSAGLTGAAGAHASENELTDTMPYDRLINNHDGELEDLRALVKRAISGQT